MEDSSFDSLNQINPFEVLGIKPGCSKSELKDAYKSMLLVTHPDKHQGDVSMVMMVMDAYKAISKYHMTEIVENVKWRHQTISNMIKWRQFESGG